MIPTLLIYRGFTVLPIIATTANIVFFLRDIYLKIEFNITIHLN